MSYDWPGNIRELENALERAVLVTTTNFIRPLDLSLHIKKPEVEDAEVFLIDDLVKNHIRRVLSTTNGNRTKAASLLGISRRALQRKMIKYGL